MIFRAESGVARLHGTPRSTFSAIHIIVIIIYFLQIIEYLDFLIIRRSIPVSMIFQMH